MHLEHAGWRVNDYIWTAFRNAMPGTKDKGKAVLRLYAISKPLRLFPDFVAKREEEIPQKTHNLGFGYDAVEEMFTQAYLRLAINAATRRNPFQHEPAAFQAVDKAAGKCLWKSDGHLRDPHLRPCEDLLTQKLLVLT